MSATEGERSSSSVWTLPCHFHTLSLMNCKSKAEAFARSLHSKLKSLGRLSGDGPFFDDEDEDYLQPDEDDVAASSLSSKVVVGDICFPSSTPLLSSSSAAAPLSGFERAQPPSSFSNGPKSKRRPNDERTYLMSYVPQRLHHGSPERTPPSAFLSPQHGEDELHFDFDISSPESPADHEEDYANGGGDSGSFGRCHHHLDHRHCSAVDDAPKLASNNGPNCCRPTAEEESGCISSVSSVITEQDNDEDDDGDSDALCRFSPVEWPDAEFPSCPWSPQPPVIVTAQPSPSGHLSAVAPNGLTDGSGCTSPAVPKLGTIVEQVTLEESDGNATPPWDDPAVVDLEGGRVAENGLVTSEDAPVDEWIDQGVVEGGHDPGFGLSSRTDVDEPMSNSGDGVGDGPEPTAVHCADTEETDETDDRNDDGDGDGDQSDLKADVDDSHGRDPSEDDEVSERSASFCRVCISPPPAFLHLGSEGSEKLPNDESESTGDCDRHEPAEKSPGRLMVDVNLSPLNEGGSSEANSPTPNDDDFPQRVRRSSSLKTGKTPPGTPNRKKIVRFADAMGLDLEAVKTVFLDDLPVVPSSAYVDLQDGAYLGGDDDALVGGLTIYNSNLSRGHLPPFGLAKPRSSLIPVFPQPGSLSDFIDRVRRQNVCLESAVVTGDFNICLVVRVVNLHFHKHVAVRYTYDDWATVHDQMAEYVADSHDGFSDKFSTVISASRLQIGDRLLFALRYLTEGSEFWDNNHGQNYCFQCFVEQQYQPSPPDDSWIHFL